MQTKNINGVSVYDYENDKPPLIFVHAFPLNAGMWNRQVEFFKSDFRVITYDVRGLGKSASADNQFMMDFYIDDLIEIIGKLGLKNVNAAGLSMGGYVIQGALIKRPELFRTVMLADTKGEKDTDEALSSRASSIKLIKNGGRKEFTVTFVRKLINDSNYGTKLKNEIEDIISLNTDDGICGAILSLATRGNYISGLKNVNVNSLILVGSDDILTPLSNAEILKHALTNSELHVIENSGHLSNMENPGEFNRLLHNFLMKYN